MQTEYIWVIFTVMFAGLAAFHCYLTKQKIEPVENHGRIKTFNGVPLGVVETINDLNHYIENVNTSNRWSNIAQAFGYSLAALTALFSFFLA